MVAVLLSVSLVPAVASASPLGGGEGGGIVAPASGPVATIVAPQAGFTYRDGEPVRLSGLAGGPARGAWRREDEEETSLRWQVVRYTGRNWEIVADLNGRDASFTPSDRWGVDTTYEVVLTASDEHGRSSVARIAIAPLTVTVTLGSDPAGVALGYGERMIAAGATITDVPGHRIALSAPQTSAAQGGATLEFTGWSDGGGARTRDFVVPQAATALVALYRTVPGAPALQPAVAPETAAPSAPPTTAPEPQQARTDVGSGLGGGEATRGGASPLPALSIDQTGGVRYREVSGWLRGTRASSPHVQIALRRGAWERGGCSWWDAGSAHFTRATRGACTKPAFLTATMRRNGDGWRWRVELGPRSLPLGEYTMIVRVLDSGRRPISVTRG